VVEIIIQRYTREAGVRNLERRLASLARAVDIKVAEREQSFLLTKQIHSDTPSLLEGSSLADSGEIDVGVNGHEISRALETTEMLVVDESMLEIVSAPPNSMTV